MGGYTRAVSKQRFSKHLPAATDTIATIEELFSTRSVPRSYKQGKKLIVSSVQESVQTGLEPETEENPLLEPLPGNV
jgi:hypothetical protein